MTNMAGTSTLENMVVSVPEKPTSCGSSTIGRAVKLISQRGVKGVRGL